jgi:AcrR family transcriptional regulator
MATGAIDNQRLGKDYATRDMVQLCVLVFEAGAMPLARFGSKVGAMAETTAKRVRRSKAQQRAETLDQILNAAEYLFSKHGLHGVTLRDVALRVGVHTSLMHYYFDDKLSLFEAVFARRASITSGRRMEALDRYEQQAAGKPTVVGALHAFLDTDLDLYISGGEAWMNYAAFGAQASNTPEGAELMDRYFDPVVLKLVGILRQALPDYAEEDIFWGYFFVTGSLMHTLARTGRIDRLSGGLCKSDDFDAIKQRIAKFMAAGFLSFKQGHSRNED